jgi:NADH dehydrogenase
MGTYAARLISKDVRGIRAAGRAPFRYVNKGLLATIGRARAVAAIGSWKFAGTLAWLVWAFVHIFYLIGFRNRILVMLEWAWAYVFFDRGARLITGEHLSQPSEAREEDRATPT